MNETPGSSGRRSLPSGQMSLLEGGRAGPDRPLAEMLSIADWRSFLPETVGLLALMSLALVLYPAAFAALGMPHPYWVPILLMSCQYGVMAGLFATLAATAAFFLGGLPDRSAGQEFYAYAAVVAGQPSAWLGTALILGALRSLHIHHQNQLREELQQTRHSAEDLADGLERAVGEVARLERRIATDSSTLASFIHGLSRLDLSDRASLAESLADLLRHGLGATTFAVYLRHGGLLEPLLAVENGAALPPGTPMPPPPALGGATGEGPGRGKAQPGGPRGLEEPSRWSPILAPATGEVLGAVVYAPSPAQAADGAADRRLAGLCRFLGLLLSGRPRLVPGTE